MAQPSIKKTALIKVDFLENIIHMDIQIIIRSQNAIIIQKQKAANNVKVQKNALGNYYVLNHKNNGRVTEKIIVEEKIKINLKTKF